MILNFDHKNEINAKKIWLIFQESYTVESKILKAINFPPLQRTVSDFLDSTTRFYAFYDKKNICGMIEIDNYGNSTHIQSLVVYPIYFRKGIASKLVSFVLS